MLLANELAAREHRGSQRERLRSFHALHIPAKGTVVPNGFLGLLVPYVAARRNMKHTVYLGMLMRYTVLQAIPPLEVKVAGRGAMEKRLQIQIAREYAGTVGIL